MKVFFSKRDWFLSIPIFLIFSCNSGNQNKEFAYSEFVALDSFEVVMPAEYLQQTNWTTYKNGVKNILVEYGLFGEDELIIHQLDFDEEAYVKTLKISKEGPEGFNAYNASVYLKNEDSLYVFPMGRNSFFLYNSVGEKVNEYPYSSPNFERYYKSSYYSSLIPLSNESILPTINDVRYDDPDYFKKVTPIQSFNLSTSKFVDKIEYPEFIHGKYIPSLTGATLSPFDEDQFLINYSFSDSIYIHNYKTKETRSLYCGADYFGKPKLLDRVLDRNEQTEYAVYEVDYEAAFYHNSKIYRIVNHVTASDYENYSIFEILSENRRLISLVELNPKTGEMKYYKLPIAKYFVFQGNHLFAGGVSIREDENESYRRFYRYTLE